MNYDNILNQFKEYMITERGLRKSTIIPYLFRVKEFLTCINKDLADINGEDILKFNKSLMCKGVTGGRNTAICAARRFIRFLFAKKITKTFEFPEIKTPTRIEIKDRLTETDVQVLRNTLSRKKEWYAGYRTKIAPKESHYPRVNTPYYKFLKERAIIEFLIATGARINEALSLNMRDINISKGECMIRDGKGGRDRRIFFNGSCQKALKEYQKYIHGNSKHRRFFPHNTMFVGRAIRKWCKNSHIDKKITCHSFRRYFADKLYGKGIDPRTIQELMGHLSFATTSRYIKPTPSQLKEKYNEAYKEE